MSEEKDSQQVQELVQIIQSLSNEIGNVTNFVKSIESRCKSIENKFDDMNTFVTWIRNDVDIQRHPSNRMTTRELAQRAFQMAGLTPSISKFEDVPAIAAMLKRLDDIEKRVTQNFRQLQYDIEKYELPEKITDAFFEREEFRTISDKLARISGQAKDNREALEQQAEFNGHLKAMISEATESLTESFMDTSEKVVALRDNLQQALLFISGALAGMRYEGAAEALKTFLPKSEKEEANNEVSSTTSEQVQ